MNKTHVIQEVKLTTDNEIYFRLNPLEITPASYDCDRYQLAKP